MSEYLGIRVVKKEGTTNTFEVTIKEKDPLTIKSEYKEILLEDTILYILLEASQKIHNNLNQNIL